MFPVSDHNIYDCSPAAASDTNNQSTTQSIKIRRTSFFVRRMGQSVTVASTWH